MKKVLVIFASPRENGNTRELLNSYLADLKDADVEEYNVYKENILPCTACNYCEKIEGCSKPDLDEFMKKFMDADLIIFATPVYNCSFPSPLKALIDRFQRFYSARFSLGKKPPIQKHREAVLLVTSGSPEEDGFEIIKKQLLSVFSVTNISLVKSIHIKNTDMK